MKDSVNKDWIVSNSQPVSIAISIGKLEEDEVKYFTAIE